MKGKTATLILVLITAAWGSSFILIKNVATDLSPFAFLTLRFILAGIILCAVFFKRRRKFNFKLFYSSLILAILLCVYMTFQIIGLRYTSASNSGFITGLSVLMVPFLSKYFLHKEPTRSNYVGGLFAIAGLGFLTGTFTNFTALNIGDLLTLIGAFGVAFHMGMVDKLTKENDELLLGIGQIVFSAIISYVFWTITQRQTFFAVNYTNELIKSVVLTAVFCTAFAFTGQVVMQKHVPPSRVALIFTLEPVFALIYALFIPGPDGACEKLTLVKVVGSSLVLLGMMISESALVDKKNYE